MTNLMALVVALEKANITAQLDAEGAMYVLEGLQELEQKGWKFISPDKDPQ